MVLILMRADELSKIADVALYSTARHERKIIQHLTLHCGRVNPVHVVSTVSSVLSQLLALCLMTTLTARISIRSIDGIETCRT